MRLSDDNARRLSALIWRERARRWLPPIAALALLLAGLSYVLDLQMRRMDRTVEVAVHQATVLGVKRSGTAPGAGIVHIHLDDGRDVDAVNTLRVLPQPGAHVVITEARHASGTRTFDLTRLSD